LGEFSRIANRVLKKEEHFVKVILKEDVEHLGKIGDMVAVAEGSGRNYLLPRGLAIEASTRNVKILEHQKKIIKAKMQKQKSDSEDLAKQLSSVSLTVAKKAGEDDKLFGSVTSRDIEDALKAEGFPMDRRRIVLEEPIKRLGVYSIPIKVHSEVTAEVKVWVVKE
jgi:large subunit ribosomal protein L9